MTRHVYRLLIAGLAAASIGEAALGLDRSPSRRDSGAAGKALMAEPAHPSENAQPGGLVLLSFSGAPGQDRIAFAHALLSRGARGEGSFRIAAD